MRHNRDVDASTWPLFGLRLRLEDIELRLPTDPDVERLIALARAGIHDPGVMPFQVAWTDRPSPGFERQAAQFHWRARAEWRPEKWVLPLMVSVAGEPVGVQDIRADNFAALRVVETGSWLGRDHQGRGIGTRMRLAVLHLAFDRLGAMAAESGAFDDNPASQRASRSIGYVENGWTLQAPAALRDRSGSVAISASTGRRHRRLGSLPDHARRQPRSARARGADPST